jgi:cytochrome b pre-mRNA-processing protein 3
MAFGFLNKLFGGDEPRDAWRPLYAATVAEARLPHWYVEGAVPDTIDGRFDMVTLILSLLLLRLEALGEDAGPGMALLTEVLVEDMEGQVREIGFGDLVVGKHVGQMMGALGGRLGAYRDGLNGGDLAGALARNLYREDAPSPAALRHVEAAVRAFAARLGALDLATLKAGQIAA